MKSFAFSSIIKKIIKVFRWFLLFLGGIFLIAIILSFTDQPYWAYYWLGTHDTEVKENPNLIILLGGGGMPSPDGLIRAYYTAEVAKKYKNAGIIIALPPDTILHENSPEQLLAKELQIRGIDSLRISFETKGFNTYSQAQNIAAMFSKNNIDTVIIRLITSPENMYRSVLTFRKAGFKNTGGKASFEKAIEEEMLLKKGKNASKIESQQLNLRYNVWNYMKYEIIVLREYTAIAYYKMRGWI
jgi:uncharacterized SAM-binding protein YcdF (DUF218 family)